MNFLSITWFLVLLSDTVVVLCKVKQKVINVSTIVNKIIGRFVGNSGLGSNIYFKLFCAVH